HAQPVHMAADGVPGFADLVTRHGRSRNGVPTTTWAVTRGDKRSERRQRRSDGTHEKTVGRTPSYAIGPAPVVNACGPPQGLWAHTSTPPRSPHGELPDRAVHVHAVRRAQHRADGVDGTVDARLRDERCRCRSQGIAS